MLFRNLFITFLLFSLPAFAQERGCDLSLRGQLNDEDNQEHLSYAVVSLLPLKKVVQSDDHGNFIFENLCAGQYSIHITHVGCRDTVVAIVLSTSMKVKLKMPHSLNALHDVEISTMHQEAQAPQAVLVLDIKKLEQVRGEDLAHQLALVPGVRMLQTGPTISKPMINGLQGYRILLLNNGVRQEGQQWGSEHAPEIDPYAANKITVVKGASAVRYGSDAIGGVVLIEPGEMPDTASVTGQTEGGYESNGRIFTSALLFQGYFDKLRFLSWRVQGSVKNGGDIKAPGYYIGNTGVREGNFSYALDYHRKKFGASVYYSQFNSRLGIFSGSHISNLTDLQVAFERGKPADSLAVFSRNIEAPYQLVEHELVKAAADMHTGPRSRFNALYALQYNKRKEFDAHDEDKSENGEQEAASEYHLQTHFAELSWEHDYIRSWRGKFGAQGVNYRNTCKGSSFIPNYSALNLGLFAIERFVRAHFELEGGIRYDQRQMTSYYYEGNVLQQPQLYFTNLNYNVGGLYRNNHLRFTANVASGWRAPSVNELYSDGLHHGAAAIEKGSKALKKEECVNFVSGIEAGWKKIKGVITTYHYRFSNYIYYSPAVQPALTLRGAFPVFNYTQTPANISGADVDLNYDVLTYLAIQGRAMWVRGNDLPNGQPLVYMPADRYTFGLRLHTENGKKIKKVYFNPSVTYTARQGRLPKGSDFVAAPGAFTLFNVEGGIALERTKTQVNISFGCRNLFNVSYREYLDRFRYYTDAAGRSFYLKVRIPLVIYDKKNRSL